MEITEVRIKLMDDSDDRLQAFCSITFDNCFVVRDLKIIDGTNGPFVAMPSRKLTSHCPNCRAKNHLRSGYCNHCGSRLKDERSPRDTDGRSRLYADIAHPINSQCREMIQNRVIAEYQTELERAKEPGYMSRYDDDYGPPDDDDYGSPDATATNEAHPQTAVQPPSSTTPADGHSRSRGQSPEGSHATTADETNSCGASSASGSHAMSETPAKRVENTHIEPAATEPRPPHRSAASPASSPSTGRQQSQAARPDRRLNDDFGAGIF